MIVKEILIENPSKGDNIDLIFGDLLIETYIEDIVENEIFVKLDKQAMQMILENKKNKSEISDPLVANTKKFALQHYPGLNPEEAFEKFMVRGILHSKENDEIQNEKLKSIEDKLNKLNSKKDLNAMSEGASDESFEAYGVYGMKSKPWRKVFKNQAAFEAWLDKNEGNVEVHGTRQLKKGVAEGQNSSKLLYAFGEPGEGEYLVTFAQGKTNSGTYVDDMNKATLLAKKKNQESIQQDSSHNRRHHFAAMNTAKGPIVLQGQISSFPSKRFPSVEAAQKFVDEFNDSLGKDYMLSIHKVKQGVAENSSQTLTIQQLATISDEALDKAYGYGRSSPGNTFGWQANLMSAAYAKKMIDAGITDIEKISDAIHKGWNVTAQKFVHNPDQFDDTEKLRQAGKLEAKLQQRAKLMKINYAQLDNKEQEKDRVVARALLQAIKGQQGVAEATGDAKFDAMMTKISQGAKPSIASKLTNPFKSIGGYVKKRLDKIQYLRLAKKYEEKAHDALEDAQNFDFADEKRINYEDEFAKNHDIATYFRMLAGVEKLNPKRISLTVKKYPELGKYEPVSVQEDMAEGYEEYKHPYGKPDRSMNAQYRTEIAHARNRGDYAIADEMEQELNTRMNRMRSVDFERMVDELHAKFMAQKDPSKKQELQAKIDKLHDIARKGLMPESMFEAEYQGRKVSLGKPFLTPDGPKKRSVYVKNPKGNVVKVNFGQKGVKIKKNNPSRRKSFRARHNCKNPGPRHKARYWSCKFW